MAADCGDRNREAERTLAQVRGLQLLGLDSNQEPTG